MSVDGSTRRTPWVDAALLAPVVAALVVVFMGVGGVRPALVWHGGLIYLGVLLTLAVFVRGRSRLLDRLRTLCARYSTPSFEWAALLYGCAAMVAGVVGMLDVDDTRVQKASAGQLEARLAELCSHAGPADARSFSAVDQPPRVTACCWTRPLNKAHRCGRPGRRTPGWPVSPAAPAPASVRWSLSGSLPSAGSVCRGGVRARVKRS